VPLGIDRAGYFHPASNGIKKLAERYRIHALVLEGTVVPYLVARLTDVQLRGWVNKLDWLEPMFQKDQAEFVMTAHNETGIGMTARPLPGTQQPHCETEAEVIMADLIRLHPNGREERMQNGDLALSRKG
jgi:hypothetical protein